MAATQQLRAPFSSSGSTLRSTRASKSVCVRVRAEAISRGQQGAQQEQQQQQQQHLLSRRGLLQASSVSLGALLITPQAEAGMNTPPKGFKMLVDRLDGYTFVFPELWTPVTTSGNDVFLRNPFNIEENLFVDISSPSSSRYNSVEDLGTPEAAAKALLDQYLNKEFMSTRIGAERMRSSG